MIRQGTWPSLFKLAFGNDGCREHGFGGFYDPWFGRGEIFFGFFILFVFSLLTFCHDKVLRQLKAQCTPQDADCPPCIKK